MVAVVRQILVLSVQACFGKVRKTISFPVPNDTWAERTAGPQGPHELQGWTGCVLTIRMLDPNLIVWLPHAGTFAAPSDEGVR